MAVGLPGWQREQRDLHGRLGRGRPGPRGGVGAPPAAPPPPTPPPGATADDPRARGWARLDETLIHALAGRLAAAYEAAFDGASHGVGDPVQLCAEWATRVALWLGDPARARAPLQLHEAG